MRLKGIAALVLIAGVSFAFTFKGAKPDMPKWCGTSGDCVDSAPRDYSEEVGIADALVDGFSTTAPGAKEVAAAEAPAPAAGPAADDSAGGTSDRTPSGSGDSSSGGSGGSESPGGSNDDGGGDGDDGRGPSGDPDPTEPPPPPPPPPTEDPLPSADDVRAAAEKVIGDVGALVDTLPQQVQDALSYVIGTLEDTIANPPGGGGGEPLPIPSQEEIEQTIGSLSDLVIGTITGLIGDLAPQLQPIIDTVTGLAEDAQQEAGRIVQEAKDRIESFDPGPTPEPTPPQQQEPIETLTVDSRDADGTDSATALQAGQAYTIVATGTYLFSGNSQPTAVADPECSANPQNGAVWNTNHWGADGDDPLDLIVGGQQLAWAAAAGGPSGCNEGTHEYSIGYTPAGTGTTNFRVYDFATYEDNFGTIEVEIYEGARSVLGGGLDDQVVALVVSLPQTAQDTVDWLIATAEDLAGTVPPIDPGDVPPGGADPGAVPTQEEVEQAVQQTVDTATAVVNDTIGQLGPITQPLIDTVMGVVTGLQQQLDATVEQVKQQLPVGGDPGQILPGGGDPGPLPTEPPVDPGDVPPGGGDPGPLPTEPPVDPGDVPPGGGDPGPLPTEPPVDPDEIVPSGEEPIDEFSVDSRSSGGATSSVSLDAGTTYWIVASGTYLFSAGDQPTAVADPECSANPPGAPLFAKNLWGQGDAYDLRVENGDVDWNPVVGTGSGCNEASHKYVYEYTPSSSGAVSLGVYDPTRYEDNLGSLDVEIYNATPEILASVGIWPVKLPPAAMALQAVLAAAWVARRRRRTEIQEVERL